MWGKTPGPGRTGGLVLLRMDVGVTKSPRGGKLNLEMCSPPEKVKQWILKAWGCMRDYVSGGQRPWHSKCEGLGPWKQENTGKGLGLLSYGDVAQFGARLWLRS